MERLRRGWLSVVIARRLRVSYLHARRTTKRDICATLEEEGERNPITQQPWGLATIARDCIKLDADWQEEARDIQRQAKAHALAEIREARRQVWLIKDYRLVLQAVKQECELLGLDEPTKVDITERLVRAAEEQGLDPADAVAAAQRIMKAARG